MTTVNAVSGSSTLFPNPQGGRGLQRSAVQQLDQALQSGNLEGARKAFATLQQSAPPPPPQGGGAQGATSGQNPFSALAKALESGDLGSAQEAFSQIQKAGGGRRPPPPPPRQSGTFSSSGMTGTSSLDFLA